MKGIVLIPFQTTSGKVYEINDIIDIDKFNDVDISYLVKIIDNKPSTTQILNNNKTIELESNDKDLEKTKDDNEVSTIESNDKDLELSVNKINKKSKK